MCEARTASTPEMDARTPSLVGSTHEMEISPDSDSRNNLLEVNGPGIEQALSGGIPLPNVRARLEYVCVCEYVCTVRSTTSGGALFAMFSCVFEVTVRIIIVTMFRV